MLLIAPLAARAESLDERFLAGLRDRRLFALAEKLCTEKLARTDLSDQQRAVYTIELSRSFAEHARQTAPDTRDQLWQQALDAPNQFARQSPTSPWLTLVRVQSGLVELSRAELLRQEAEVAAGGPERLEESRQQLRAAITELRTAKDIIAEELRSRPPTRKPEPGQMTTAELLSLEKNVQYQLARAYRNQGQTYPPGSDDQINSLTQAAELLKPLTLLDKRESVVLAKPVGGDRLPSAFERRRGRAGAIGSARRPGTAAANCLGGSHNAKIGARARTTPPQALAIFQSGRSLEGQTSAELDLAYLETCLAAWRKANEAKQTAEAQQWQNAGGLSWFAKWNSR